MAERSVWITRVEGLYAFCEIAQILLWGGGPKMSWLRIEFDDKMVHATYSPTQKMLPSP